MLIAALFIIPRHGNNLNELIYKTNRPTDFKNKLMVPKGKSGWEEQMRSSRLIHTHDYIQNI